MAPRLERRTRLLCKRLTRTGSAMALGSFLLGASPAGRPQPPLPPAIVKAEYRLAPARPYVPGFVGSPAPGWVPSAHVMAPEGNEIEVNTYTTGAQGNVAVAMDDDGNFVVVWTSNGQDGSGDGIFGQRYNAAGVAQGSEFPVNTYTTNSQSNPAVAMDDDGNFVVTWDSSGEDGSSFGVYGRRYNAAGVAQGGAFPVNSQTTGSQSSPAVAMDDDGDFVVTWQSNGQDGSGYGVYGQRFNAAGVAQGGEFRANSHTSGIQAASSVAMNANGDFVVTWYSAGQDGSGNGVYGQRYNAAGVAQDAEFRVNTETSGSQQNASVAMDDSGDFVVVWQSNGQDGSGTGVFGQRYNAAGVAQGAEFQVNTYTSGIQQTAAVAMDADGDFVVAWQSFGQDGNSYGVYAKTYTAAGTVLVDETRVNVYTTGSQNVAAVAADATGRFTVMWQSNGQDGDNTGIYGRAFDSFAALPVELTSFTARSDGEAVRLAWTTASETNNAGFDVERRRHDSPAWERVAFVEGHGSTTQQQSYSYLVRDLAPGVHHFRLRQVDYDGAYAYSPVIEVALAVPGTHLLSEAYPNPFNPQASFTLSVSAAQHVRMTLHDALGRQVVLLHEGPLGAGQAQRFTVDGTGLPSGSYLLRVQGETFQETRTLVLTK